MPITQLFFAFLSAFLFFPSEVFSHEANALNFPVTEKFLGNEFCPKEFFCRELTKYRVILTVSKRAQNLAISSLAWELNEYRRRHPEKSQIPEGAVLILENKTGAVKALVWGRDQAFQFNRVVKGRRQVGSAIKPFVYLAALEEGWQLNNVILDQPLEIKSGNDLVFWPKNFDNVYKGEITLLRGLAESRNAATVQLAARIGIDKISAVIARFGFSEKPPPFLSIALGAGSVSLFELVRAFSVFPNGGLKIEPYLIDSIFDGDKLIFKKESLAAAMVAEKVAEKETVSAIKTALRETAETGTARAAKSLRPKIYGKTGTTNGATDVWFVGFNSQYTIGVWIGYDAPESLGDDESGAKTALPVFMKIYSGLYKKRKAK